MPKILSVTPTIYLRQDLHCLKQRILLQVDCQSVESFVIRTEGAGYQETHQFDAVVAGVSELELYVREAVTPTEVTVSVFLLHKGTPVVPAADRKAVTLNPVKRWVVHVVQLSHHDIGYTDLPSSVMNGYIGQLDEALEYADATDSWPEDTRFRIVIEQACSVDWFLRHAKPERAKKMVQRMREGTFELTALFGNMTTEIMGHELMYRTLYHAAALKRQYGIPVTTAEHNDITGFSRGLGRALADAGIRFFCPGLPNYYDWGEYNLASFWDQHAIFGSKGPGSFWWEVPAGRKLLFWSNNQGCGGDSRGTLPGLEQRLLELEAQGYPYQNLRWPVQGAMRDNSPYIPDYAHTIRRWQEKWAWPKLVSSTNQRFFTAFSAEVPPSLPAFAGELPGQDYPVAATSTAKGTAVNRNNHVALVTAEKLATVVSLAAGASYPGERLKTATEAALLYDEHAWGFQFPCGPAMEASQAEKTLHALRAAAWSHEVISKSMAILADNVQNNQEGYSLLVFNPSTFAKSGPLRIPFREMDNTGSCMDRVPPEKDDQGAGYLRGVLLPGRWHANLPPNLLDGCFELVDMETNEPVPFQLLTLDGADEPVPHAAERYGLGSGTKRLGLFELPVGLKRDLCLMVRELPAMGYRTYHFRPCPEQIAVEPLVFTGDHFIENEFYRVELDTETGEITRILDKSTGQELTGGSYAHSFACLSVQMAGSPETHPMTILKAEVSIRGPLCAVIDRMALANGHPSIRQKITLWAGAKQIHVDTRVLKDTTPLQESGLRFSFSLSPVDFRYEGVLSAISPVQDFLPGAFSDTLAVQHWVRMSTVGTDGEGYHILWTSLDAPIVEIGGKWPGYISPAHRCITDDTMRHPPQSEAEMHQPVIYSRLFSNNFGTNFSVSQSGSVLFRHVITTAAGMMTDAHSTRLGWNAATPFETMFATQGKGVLPPSGHFLPADSDQVAILAFKPAEDGRGHIVRLWNLAASPVTTRLFVPVMALTQAWITDAVEFDVENGILPVEGRTICLDIPADTVMTIRLL